MKYCYKDTIANFLQIDKKEWLNNYMVNNLPKVINKDAEQSQIEAWEDCFDRLVEELPSFKYQDLHIIFEYKLPYTSKRRPDVIIVSDEIVLILEFKRKTEKFNIDRDQAADYAKDIAALHRESEDKKVLPFLVLTYTDCNPYEDGIVKVTSRGHIIEALHNAIEKKLNSTNIDKWIDSAWDENPNIIEAAKTGFALANIPSIKRANSLGFSAASEYLRKMIDWARKEQQYVLAVISGAPGAGKTYLGLNVSIECNASDRSTRASFMTGNNALIYVLEDALEKAEYYDQKANTQRRGIRAPIRNIHAYIDGVLDKDAPGISYNVIVFDEGQRAWNLEQMKKRHNINASEPDLIIKKIEDSELEWCFLIVLDGAGQELSRGEDGGVVLWNNALANSKKQWNVLCPSKYDKAFKGLEIIDLDNKVTDNSNGKDACSADNTTALLRDRLNLTKTIRSMWAKDLGVLVNYIIDGNISYAKEMVPKVRKTYPLYVTQDLKLAKEYCEDRYKDEKRYGLIASSQSMCLPQYGIDNRYDKTKVLKSTIASWYNAPLTSQECSNSFKSCVTEYGCQGLEIDIPIVCWEKDMIWSETQKTWLCYYNAPVYENGKIVKDKNERKNANGEKKKFRKNAYRVLMTRGRNALVIFIPPEKELKDTYNMFIDIGFEEPNL